MGTGPSKRHMFPGRRQYERRQSVQNAREYRGAVIQCWTCGENGHISRFCEMNCFKNCGKKGHAAWSCSFPRKALKVRQLQEITWDSDNEICYDDEGSNMCSLDLRPQVEIKKDERTSERVDSKQAINQQEENAEL